MVDSISSIISGGVTGLLGTMMSSIFDFFEKKRAAKVVMENRQIDLQIAQAANLPAGNRAAIQTGGNVAVAPYKHDTHSFLGDRELTSGQTWLVVILDFVRGITRPVITYGLLLYTGVLVCKSKGTVGQDAESTLLYLTTAAVLWWFGDRAKRNK